MRSIAFWPRGAWQAPFVAAVMLFSSRPALAQLRTVMLSGQPAPGAPAGSVFDRAVTSGVPQINQLGQTAFQYGISGGGTTLFESYGIWSDAGGLHLSVRGKDPIPGFPANHGFAPIEFRIGDSGALAISSGVRVGDGDINFLDRVLFSETGGVLRAIAHDGVQVPGMASGVRYDASHGFHAQNSVGQVLISSNIEGPGITAANNHGMFVVGNDSAAEMIRMGSPVPGAAAGVSFVAAVDPARMTDLGEVAAHARLQGAGVVETNNTAIVAGLAGNLTMVAREGDRAPGTPSNYTFGGPHGVTAAFGEPTLNRRGHLAIMSGMRIDGIYSTAGIFSELGTGVLHLVAREGQPVPELPVGTNYGNINPFARTSDQFDPYPLSMNQHQLVFHTELNGSGVTSGVNDRALMIESSGRVRPLLRLGDQPPGTPAGTAFTQDLRHFTMNAAGQVVLNALLTGPNFSEQNRSGIWATDRAGQWQKVVRAGDQIEVGPGDVRTVAGAAMEARSAGDDGVPRGINDVGQIAFAAVFTDGSSGVFVTDQVAAKLLIPTGAEWKFRDDGVNLGTAWRTPAFDDATWGSGPAALGYGEPYHRTITDFGPDPDNKLPTTYLRKSFSVAGADAVDGLNLEVMADDGMAIYVNGHEVARDNLNPRARWGAFANVTLGNSGEKALRHYRVDPEMLVDGQNLIAVELHQASGNSSDLSFDLRMTTGPTPPAYQAKFGTLTPNARTGFEEPPAGATSYMVGTNPPRVEMGFSASGGAVFQAAPQTKAYHLNSGALNLTTDLIDVRNFDNVQVGIDVRTWENSTQSDFEAADHLKVAVEISRDGLDFSSLDLVPMRTGGSAIGDPDDQLKGLDTGQFGAYVPFRLDLPDEVAALRVVIDAMNDSNSERFFFDNITVTGDPISAALLTLFDLDPGYGPEFAEDILNAADVRALSNLGRQGWHSLAIIHSPGESDGNLRLWLQLSRLSDPQLDQLAAQLAASNEILSAARVTGGPGLESANLAIVFHGGGAAGQSHVIEYDFGPSATLVAFAVPEPATMVGVFFVAAAALVRRSRKRVA